MVAGMRVVYPGDQVIGISLDWVECYYCTLSCTSQFLGAMDYFGSDGKGVAENGSWDLCRVQVFGGKTRQTIVVVVEEQWSELRHVSHSYAKQCRRQGGIAQQQLSRQKTGCHAERPFPNRLNSQHETT